MVVGPINDFVASDAGMVTTGVVLTLVGLNHITDPGGSLVAGLVSGLPTLAYQGVGVVVASAGLGQINNALNLY